jgi:hypothetical protein
LRFWALGRHTVAAFLASANNLEGRRRRSFRGRSGRERSFNLGSQCA